MTDWQPIETAPIGQYVLVAFNWKKGSTWYDPSEDWNIQCGTYVGGQYVENIYLDLNEMDAMWMPLPPPPANGEEK